MPTPTILFFIGSPGAGKSTLVKLLLGTVDYHIWFLDKDNFSETLKSKPIAKSSSGSNDEIDQDSIYCLMLSVAYGNTINTNQTISLQGNFSPRFIKDPGLFDQFIEPPNNFNVHIIHVVCSDPKVQHARVVTRAINEDTYKRDKERLSWVKFVADRTDRMEADSRWINTVMFKSNVNYLKIDTANDSNIGLNVAKIVESINHSRKRYDLKEAKQTSSQGLMFSSSNMRRSASVPEFTLHRTVSPRPQRPQQPLLPTSPPPSPRSAATKLRVQG